MTPAAESPVAAGALGLPAETRACLFDLDGALTATATVHAAAWQEMFDSYLKSRAQRLGTPFVAFDPATDYDTYVDGTSRADGTASFLASRGIELPVGGPDDPAGAVTITALGETKNEIPLRRIRHDGVQAYAGSVRYVRAVRMVGLRTAVVSSSANCAQILAAAGIAEMFEIHIDGLSLRAEGMAGKPEPDSYLAAARALGVAPGPAAVFEDAIAGVQAGRAGRFGYVVGVDRVRQSPALRAAGADIVVTDPAELLERR